MIVQTHPHWVKHNADPSTILAYYLYPDDETTMAQTLAFIACCYLDRLYVNDWRDCPLQKPRTHELSEEDARFLMRLSREESIELLDQMYGPVSATESLK